MEMDRMPLGFDHTGLSSLSRAIGLRAQALAFLLYRKYRKPASTRSNLKAVLSMQTNHRPFH